MALNILSGGWAWCTAMAWDMQTGSMLQLGRMCAQFWNNFFWALGWSYKWMCSPASCKSFCAYHGERDENGPSQLPPFQRSQPIHSKISMNRSTSHLPLALCKLPFLCSFSMLATVSLCPSWLLNLWTPCPTGFTKLQNSALWILKAMRISLLHVNSWVQGPVLPSLHS